MKEHLVELNDRASLLNAAKIRKFKACHLDPRENLIFQQQSITQNAVHCLH